MVCVTKIIKLFGHYEVDADNDLQAKHLAITEVRKSELNGNKIVWSEEEKPIYKAEVVNE